ncbi:MAG: hypothetical protein AABW47_00030 [Nanoarchaeota archaeon]
MALENDLNVLRNEPELNKLSLDWIHFDGNLIGGVFLWEDLAEEIIQRCDEEGNFKLDYELRKKIKQYRENGVRKQFLPVIGSGKRKVKVNQIAYRNVNSQEDMKKREIVCFTPREYIALGRPKIIEEEITRKYSASKK